MSATGSGSMRKCPACGAENSNLSLFCAECGTALNGVPWAASDDATQGYQPVSTATSHADDRYDAGNGGTAAYRPYVGGTGSFEPEGHSTWAEPVNTGYANGRPDAGESAPVVSMWEAEVDRGVRGFVLGTLAWLIILAVFVLFLWVGVFSQSFKDDVKDLIPGLAAITLF